MNIFDILKGIENLVVQLLLMIIYIPKTIYKIIKDPAWVSDYVKQELNNKDRFQDYVSPVLLYLLSSVVLFIIFSMLELNFGDTITTKIALGKSAQDGADDKVAEEFLNNLKGLTGILAALAFMSMPLFWSLITELFRKGKFLKSNITQVLYIKCYYFSPPVLAIMMAMVIFSLDARYSVQISDSINLSEVVPSVIIFLTLIWFVFAMLRFIAMELQIGYWKASGVLLTGAVVILSGFITFTELSDSAVDKSPAGIAEELELSLAKTGQFTISIEALGEGDVDIYLVNKWTVDPNINIDSITKYPLSGSINYNKKVLASHRAINDSLLANLDRSTQNSITLNPNRIHNWTFVGNTNDQIEITVSEQKTKDPIYFKLVDSSGKAIASNYSMEEFSTNEGYGYFTLPKNDTYGIIIDNPSARDNFNFEIQILDEYDYYNWVENYAYDFVENFENISFEEQQAGLDSLYHQYLKTISYESSGSINYQQKVRTHVNSYQTNSWTFKGEYWDMPVIKVEPVDGENSYLDLEVDVLDDEGDSILLMEIIPVGIWIVFSLLFGIAFTMRIREWIIALRNNAYKTENPGRYIVKRVLKYIGWIFITLVVLAVISIAATLIVDAF